MNEKWMFEKSVNEKCNKRDMSKIVGHVPIQTAIILWCFVEIDYKVKYHMHLIMSDTQIKYYEIWTVLNEWKIQTKICLNENRKSDPLASQVHITVKSLYIHHQYCGMYSMWIDKAEIQ
mgnify:CR=1 FL=1